MLVVGGGIAGIHAALTLAEAGKHVYLVEREPSIGGQMAKFDKTFPTLDCAACILTPKMVQVGQHPEHRAARLQRGRAGVSGYVGNFKVKVRRKARYIDEDRLHRLRSLRRELQLGRDPVGVRPWPRHPPGRLQARSRRPSRTCPVIDRAGTSPCTFSCPAGIKAHGYVSLIRKGEYEKAFDLVLDATPLVGSLGRACYAQCEAECTREDLEGPLPIRRLKRFIADTHYQRGDGASVATAAAERQAGGGDRFRAGGPDCRLAARAAGIPASRSSRRRPSPAACCGWPFPITVSRPTWSSGTSRT